MNDAHCGKDYETDVTIANIANLVVYYNGQPISYDSEHSSGNQWKIYIDGADIPNEGTLEFWDGDTLLKTVSVVCP